MRTGRNGSVWRNSAGRVIAVNLGSDFCAEHEWGIKDINSALGIPGVPHIDFGLPFEQKIILSKLTDWETTRTGIAARQMTGQRRYHVVHNLESKGTQVSYFPGKKDYFTNKKSTHTMWGLQLTYSNYTEKDIKWESLAEYYSPDSSEVFGAWDSRTFGFMLRDRVAIEDMVVAFKENDIAIWQGKGGPFDNGGLVIAIVSRLPEDFKDTMKETDLDTLALLRVAVETGIHEKLRNANKKFFALSPKWFDAEKKFVRFWLNPFDQQNYNFGWYTVEELEAWTRNEGPIVEKKKST